MLGRRGEVLRTLREAQEPLSLVEIAGRVGVHPNTARFHVENLVERGLLEQVAVAPTGPGRPGSRFRAVRSMDRDGLRDYRVLAEVMSRGLATSDQPSAQAMELGRAWGRAQVRPPVDGKATSTSAAVGRMAALLADLGFAPEWSGRARGVDVRIGLRHCPFLELAESRPEIVCAAHLGMMQGAAEAWQAPFTVDRLDPFAEPDLCVAHLRTNEADG